MLLHCSEILNMMTVLSISKNWPSLNHKRSQNSRNLSDK